MMEGIPQGLLKFIGCNARKPRITPQVKIISELETSGGQSYTRHRGIAISQVMPDACVYFSIEDLVSGQLPLQLVKLDEATEVYIVNRDHMTMNYSNTQNAQEHQKTANDDISTLAAAVAGISDEVINYQISPDIFSIPSHEEILQPSNIKTIVTSYPQPFQNGCQQDLGIYSNAPSNTGTPLISHHDSNHTSQPDGGNVMVKPSLDPRAQGSRAFPINNQQEGGNAQGGNKAEDILIPPSGVVAKQKKGKKRGLKRNGATLTVEDEVKNSKKCRSKE